jgi:hypothetical protein
LVIATLPPNGALEIQLAQLVNVAWVLLIPVGVLLALVLYKVLALLQAGLEFVTIARYDVVPMLKEVRETLVHVEAVTSRVSGAVQQVERVAHQAKPFLQRSGNQASTGLQKLANSGGVLLSGIVRAFTR